MTAVYGDIVLLDDNKGIDWLHNYHKDDFYNYAKKADDSTQFIKARQLYKAEQNIHVFTLVCSESISALTRDSCSNIVGKPGPVNWNNQNIQFILAFCYLFHN